MKKLILFLMLFVFAVTAFSQIPQTLSYQGLLTDATGTGTPVANDKYNINFNFYTVATGGTVVQSRTVNGVVTFQGLFTTIIGNSQGGSSNTPLNNLSPALGSTQYFVGLQVNNGAELTPRVALTAVPYAFAASSLDANATIGGNQLNSPITNSAVTIQAAQVTGTIATAQIADGAVTDAKIAGLSGNKITGTITTAQIADGSVNNAKLATGIDGTKIGTGIKGDNVTTGTIPSSALPAVVGFSAGYGPGSGKNLILPNQSSASPLATIINWDTPTINVGNGFNSASGIFTAPTNGWYSFVAQLVFVPPTSTVFTLTQNSLYLYFTKYVSGAAIPAYYFNSFSGPGGVARLSGSCLVYLNAGEGWGLSVSQVSGNPVSFGTDVGSFFFQGVRIGN